MNLTKNKLFLYSAILAFLGFLDATYLTIIHYRQIIPPCTIGSCETVLNSEFATILGIPTALLGSLFYLSVIVITLLILTNYKKMYVSLFYLLATTGFGVSLFLLYIQAFVLHSFCQYCLLSAATSTGIFILAVLQIRKEKNSLLTK
ncbi:MAG: vitamin K epoxide reductase family protein [Candidatus Levybacteria bacterium]|nr:vitamin K epoxide reductase family protein [Candidatus Levybacteria bacterium]